MPCEPQSQGAPASQMVLRHVHLDAAADDVAAAFLHDRLPPPPAALRRGLASDGRARGRDPGSGQEPAGAARKPLSKADRKRQKQVGGWTGVCPCIFAVCFGSRD